MITKSQALVYGYLFGNHINLSKHKPGSWVRESAPGTFTYPTLIIPGGGTEVLYAPSAARILENYLCRFPTVQCKIVYCCFFVLCDQAAYSSWPMIRA